MSHQDAPLIAVDGLGVEIDGQRVINEISFQSSAQRVAILGKNGSGKTTLAKTLCGVFTPHEGSVRLFGVDVIDDRAKAIETVGYLFQNADHQIIFPTVEEEIAFGLGSLGYPPKEALEKSHAILHQWNRGDWAKRHVSSLSGGEKQLLCLMAVLAMSPKILFLDEPFSGLDIPTRRRLARIFEELDLALVHITHAVEDIAQYDEALWIEEGRLKAHGPAAQVSSAYLEAMEREAGA